MPPRGRTRSLARARHGYNPPAGDIVIYKSVGIGLEDVALANLVWQRAG